MTQSFEHQLRPVDRTVLLPLMQRALRTDIDDILTWDHGPLTDGFGQEHGETYGIYWRREALFYQSRLSDVLCAQHPFAVNIVTDFTVAATLGGPNNILGLVI